MTFMLVIGLAPRAFLPASQLERWTLCTESVSEGSEAHPDMLSGQTWRPWVSWAEAGMAEQLRARRRAEDRTHLPAGPDQKQWTLEWPSAPMFLVTVEERQLSLLRRVQNFTGVYTSSW